MKFLRSLFVGAILWIGAAGASFAQCGTTAPANKFCGNDTGSSALATWKSIPAGALTPVAGGTVLGNPTGASAVPIATIAPVLGIPGASTGQVGLAGATSGTAILRAQATAGSAVSLLPTAAGTLVGTATLPLVINATTGLITLPGQVGGVLAGAGPAFTPTPELGVASTTQGTLTFHGGSSGAVLLVPQADAGSPVLQFPNTSGTFAVGATTPLALNTSTGNLSITGLAGGVLAGSPPAFQTSPELGVPGSITGSLSFAGAASGSVEIVAQNAAGTGILFFPTISGNGTFAVTASGPIALNGVTGNLTCTTCVTSSGGGAVTGTAPISVSAAGVVSINAPYTTLTASNGGIVYSGTTNLAILAGTATANQHLASGASGAPSWTTATYPATTTINQILYSSAANAITGLATLSGGILNANSSGVPSITRTPVLGVAGTAVGTIGFQNATSGTITLSPPAGALGTVTLTMPALTDTLMSRTSTDTMTNKTYNAQGTGNVFQLDGVTVTGKAATADYFAGTSTAKLIAPSVIYQGPTTTTFGATTTFDFATFIDTGVTLTGNITTMTLTNVTPGKAGAIVFQQDATGSRTAVFNTIFKFASGAIPTLTTTPNAVDVLSYACRTTTFCVAALIKDVRNP